MGPRPLPYWHLQPTTPSRDLNRCPLTAALRAPSRERSSERQGERCGPRPPVRPAGPGGSAALEQSPSISVYLTPYTNACKFRSVRPHVAAQ